MSIIEKIKDRDNWEIFIEDKISKGNMSKSEIKDIRDFIDNDRYSFYFNLIKENKFPTDYPQKIVINKISSNKKRIVYSYRKEENIVFKFIAFYLYKYDYMFQDCCYAFRKNYGVRDAIGKFKRNSIYSNKYGYKADVRNYFNSIDRDILLDKLAFLIETDNDLYKLFNKILREKKVYDKGVLIEEDYGAMAGTPMSPFFANIYLADMDKYITGKGAYYFRYSDDILIFADSEEEICDLSNSLIRYLKSNKLEINKDKVAHIKPGDKFEFLGFSYNKGEIDISYNSKNKIKGKIKRKANSLLRWQKNKKLSSDKAAIGFIRAMNSKFFGTKDGSYVEDDLSLARWYFPNITTDRSLRELDEYIQKYIRYTVTGRHYKGNYRITYEQMKKWGYVNLVHSFYKKIINNI